MVMISSDKLNKKILKMELKKILDIFEKHGFNENNCSFFRQEDITDIAKELITAINYNQCCMGEAEQFTCKHPIEVCTWLEGGIIGKPKQYPCDKCK